MKKAKSKSENKCETIRIEGGMNITRVLDLKPVLIDPLHRSLDLEIDLSAVSELDTAGLQLLILAKKIAHEKQQQLRLTGHSAAVLDMFELLNLAPYFGDPLVMHSDAQ